MMQKRGAKYPELVVKGFLAVLFLPVLPILALGSLLSGMKKRRGRKRFW